MTSTTSLDPIANAPSLYLNGMNISILGNTTLSVAVGACRDMGNQYDIITTTATTVSNASVGINALDSGTVAASTIYAVWAIADPTGFRPTGFTLSTSFSAPALPFGYGIVRRIGVAITDASSHFIALTQVGNNSQRNYFYDAPLRVLNAGASTSYAAVDLSTAVPPIVTPVIFNYSYTPSTAGHSASFRATGSASTTNLPSVTAPVVSQAQLGQVTVFTGVATSKAEIDYIVLGTDALTLYVYSFADQV